ncbi:MAG: hypothetical protein IJH37_05940 [Clostridia bacterium]|nr:hypothetical protein [Clostridia bacterium]
MNKYNIAIAAVVAALNLFPMGSYAKSLELVNSGMDYRREIIEAPELKLYTRADAEEWPYYGAKFEPRSGIYIGTPYNKPYPGISNAIYTEYNWFVPREEIDNLHCARVHIAETESKHTKLRGINLNFALKHSQIIDIRDYSNWLYNLIDQYASYGEDILLIFGKEMNIDDNFNDPELFKECFRFVADYANTKENIAMVWSPNDMGGLDTTFEEFWPGDEYVDWIGCSLYTMPFFQRKPDGPASGNYFFLMNNYAHPAIHAKMIHEFMVENGIKKPVIITEGGVGYEAPDGTDYTEFAVHQLRSYYSDICRRYPEFKCIVSFNEYFENGDLYRYDMSKNPVLLPLITELTSDPVYLKSYPSEAEYSYSELKEGAEFKGSIDVSAYAYIPGVQNLVVRYLIDGEWVSEKTEPPYAVSLTSELVPYGDHVLTAEIYDGKGIKNTTNYNVSLLPPDPEPEPAKPRHVSVRQYKTTISGKKEKTENSQPLQETENVKTNDRSE